MHRNILSRVIFSKQCDHDLDLMPFWLRWYQEIFKADKILVTPVKTPKSSIEKTLAFYESQNIETHPLYFPKWDDGLVWQAQLGYVKSQIGKSLSGALIISADTDQFFSPVHDELQTREAVFRRIFIYSDRELSSQTLPETQLFSHTSLDLVAGFYSELENNRIHATGHFAGITPRTKMPCEFHLALRGFDQFLAKVRSLDVEMDDSPGALHWKNWSALYEKEGESGLLKEYNLQMTGGKSLKEDLLHRSFRTLAEGSPGQEAGLPTVETDAPFASQVIGSRFQIHLKQGTLKQDTVTRYLRYPINEAFIFNHIFQSGAFELAKSTVDSPELIIDIGANIGLFSVYMKSLYPDSEIHAFEGNKDTVKLLSENLASLENTFTYNKSWSDKDEILDFFKHPFNSFEDSPLPGPDLIHIPKAFQVSIAASSFDSLYQAGKRVIVRLAVNGNEEKIIISLAERLYLISDFFLEMADKAHLESLAETLAPIFSLERINSSGPRHIAYLASKNFA